MSEINHEIKTNATQAKVYEALSTVQGLKSWYSGKAEGDGKAWRFAHADHPVFRFEVSQALPPNAVEWRCIEGPNDSAGTTVSFRLSPAAKGRTLIELAHKGWPGTHGNFKKCNTYWGVLLHHLKKYVETGVAGPAFD